MKKRTISRLALPILALALASTGLAAERQSEKRENEEKSEQKIQLQDCPPAVQNTIKEQAGDGKILWVEKITAGDEDEGQRNGPYFEAKVKKGDARLELKVAADGKLIKVAADDEDDDEKKEPGK